jgi:uncharacterized protein YdeI (YjbR/CyaY-like superfamily)
LAFKNVSRLGYWLEKHHGTAIELWVRIFKSDTGVPSVTWNDCVIESIRVGWIDGQLTLDHRNLYSIYYRLHTAKKPETRARRIAQIVAKPDRGEKFH